MSNACAYHLPETWRTPTSIEATLIESLLGKTPQSEFQVVVVSKSGEPLVIENAPFFYDGTPMPTRYWLLDPELSSDVAKIESSGGVKRAESEIAPEIISQIHSSYESSRDELIDETYVGPRPTGGVGGTRRGVKCLHAHVANFLVTGKDEIGEWTMNEINKLKESD